MLRQLRSQRPTNERVYIMIGLSIQGAYCNWPRETYNPNDLPREYHESVRLYFQRWAEREMLPDARSRKEAAGLRERAAEAASEAYIFWLTGRYKNIPKGAHHSAIKGVRRFMSLSGWKGKTGQRRANRRTITAERLAHRERLRQRQNPTPESVAVAVERIAKTPMHSKKAYRLAKRIGLPGVRELVREACGFAAE